MEALLTLLLVPLFATFGAAIAAVLMFWPVMLIFGALHSYLAWVPAIGWQPAMLVVALFALLIPTASNSKD